VRSSSGLAFCFSYTPGVAKYTTQYMSYDVHVLFWSCVMLSWKTQQLQTKWHRQLWWLLPTKNYVSSPLKAMSAKHISNFAALSPVRVTASRLLKHCSCGYKQTNLAALILAWESVTVTFVIHRVRIWSTSHTLLDNTNGHPTDKIFGNLFVSVPLYFSSVSFSFLFWFIRSLSGDVLTLGSQINLK
jgi:hypothetical protein